MGEDVVFIEKITTPELKFESCLLHAASNPLSRTSFLSFSTCPICKLNHITSPHSSNVHSTYSESWVKANREVAALLDYETPADSVLNPKDNDTKFSHFAVLYVRYITVYKNIEVQHTWRKQVMWYQMSIDGVWSNLASSKEASNKGTLGFAGRSHHGAQTGTPRRFSAFY